MENDSYQEKRLKKYYQKILEEKLAFIIGIPILAFLITLFIFHFYRVDGTSMQNTLQDSDMLLVEKIGKTGSLIFRYDYTPKRYDVVVFKEPDFSEGEELVKRVIGLPGDEVKIKNNQVLVYNAKNPQGIKIDDNLPAEAKVITQTDRAEEVDIKISPGEVFVLGDNRPGSADSRIYGPVQTKNITGKVVVRIKPKLTFF